MANGYPDFGPDFTGTPANDNAPGGVDPPWGDTDLPDWAGGGKGFAPPVRQPFKPRIVPPSEPDPRFVADPNQVQQSPTISRSSIIRSLLGRVAPMLGRVGGGAATGLGAYFGSTQPAETGEFHPRVRFDPATSGFKPGTTYYDPLSGKPTGLPNPPMHPSSAPYPLPYESGFPYPSPDAGIGQGPFAGRPDTTTGIGQGPFAGRPGEVLRNGPGDRPSGVPPIYAPAVPPPRPKDAAAAQRPDLGYYGQTNLDPLGRGGRRWGGPLDAPQSTAFDLSKLFQGQPQ